MINECSQSGFFFAVKKSFVAASGGVCWSSVEARAWSPGHFWLSYSLPKPLTI